MHWLLPVTLVLLAGILIAAIHFVFVRWMARRSEPARSRDANVREHGKD